MWELACKENWVQKNWCFWTVVLEKTLESPLDCKEILPVNPKGNQSWIFIGRTDAEDELPILWPPDAKNWLIGKDPGAGIGRRRREWQTMRWLNSITYLMGMSLSKLQELVMPSKHFIPCCPLLFPPSIFPSTRVFPNESTPCIRWPKCGSFSFNIQVH